MLAGVRTRLVAKVRGRASLDELVARGLKVGENVWLGENVYLDPAFPWLIEIGDECDISFDVVILAHDAAPRVGIGYSRIGRVCLERGSRIGCGTLIMPGVTIGEGSMVGAFSVVTRDVPSGVLMAGNPAKPVASMEDYLAKEREKMADRPVWPSDGWTLGGGITDERKRIQWNALADGDGYVQ
jgi:maltose O-acetyltransferase